MLVFFTIAQIETIVKPPRDEHLGALRSWDNPQGTPQAPDDPTGRAFLASPPPLLPQGACAWGERVPRSSGADAPSTRLREHPESLRKLTAEHVGRYSVAKCPEGASRILSPML